MLDLDDPASWPPEALNAVDDLLADRDDLAEAEYGDEVRLDAHESSLIDEAIGDTPLAAYHATRLLPHEVESVRRVGLLPLTPELVNLRIGTAVESGAVDTVLAERLRPAALRYAVDPGRTQQVCFTGSRKSLQRRSGFWRLFTYWGGEAIYWDLDDKLPDPALLQLSHIGTPAVVVAALPPSGSRHGRGVRDPELPRRLVAVRLGLDPGLEIHVDVARPGEIVDVVLQGSPAWAELAPVSQH